ncbi:kinase-interacting protein 1 [Salvia miltiorrhiza]|uniref:kinase-interacting protein 1 n=1 Tax=Salvia miltiorrhiza TaxID=226208 RepID=UPI0025ABDE4B|nr:kinase-interacting protein 1 [Salvia miltiorrhiza]
MLQRAANHAYSWWWASHIRTKQSKWLEQSLQDMEEKVQGMLQLIEGDGDSFAKRAEMYYRRRPELICAVEEAYKVFRALADRYDLLSKDFQNANHTIATVFPEQVQFGMADDDDIPKIPDNFVIPEMNINMSKIPQVPKAPARDLKTIISKASKQFQVKKLKAQSRQKSVVKSGLSKEEALEEINKLQKEILSLQTVKEFVKSSYESGIAKYWGIESQVMEMHQKISRLQDEFNMDSVIEDEEARTLMAEAALKSCQETLAMLQEKQEKTALEAMDEYQRIEASCERLRSLREKYMLEAPAGGGDLSRNFSQDVAELLQETKELEELPEKLEETLDTSALAQLSVSQLADKIDLLVNKVITLETAVSSQTVLVNTLRSENDDLNAQIRTLEEENESLGVDAHSLSSKVIQMEEKLNKVQDLNKNVESRNTTLQTNFAKAKTSIDTLAEKLSSVKVEDDLGASSELDNVSAEPNTTSPDHPSENVSAPKEEEEHTSPQNPAETLDEVGEAFADADDHLSTELGSVEAGGEDERRSSSKSDEEARSLKGDQDVEKLSSAEGEGGANDEAVENGSESGVKEEEKEVVMKDVREIGEEEEEGAKRRIRRSVSSVHDQEHHVESGIRKASSFSNRKTMLEILQEESEESFQNRAKSRAKEKEKEKDEDDISWQQILLSGMEDREKILLKEYTTILRNYKEVKKKLNEVEMKERDSQFDTTLQMRELKKAISRRDEEIITLRRRLSSVEGDANLKEDNLPISEDDALSQEGELLSLTKDIKGPPLTDGNDDTGVVFMAKSPSLSRVEEKLRTDIDAILDENLDFWFRFSTAFHQIQKFKTEVRDLEEEMSKLREKRKADTQLKSEVVPIFKHLRDIQRELTVWLEQSAPLKDELSNRFSSLCTIQEEITKALKEGVEEDEIRFSSHQAAKLQGEVLNMKQENEKVREELEAGLDHVSMLQLQIDKTLTLLDDEFGISEQSEHRHKVPLRSFIFGNKSKKPKNSLFSCMHPSRKYQVLRAGIRLSNHTNSS